MESFGAVAGFNKFEHVVILILHDYENVKRGVARHPQSRENQPHRGRIVVLKLSIPDPWVERISEPIARDIHR